MPDAAVRVIEGIDQFPEAELAQSHNDIIDAVPVKKSRVARCVMTAGHDHGAGLLFDFICQPQNGVGLAGDGGEPDHIRRKPVQVFFQRIRRHLQIGNGDLVAIQIAGNDFKGQGFPPENHFDRIDPVFLFGNAFTAVGRIHQKNLHHALPVQIRWAVGAISRVDCKLL